MQGQGGILRGATWGDGLQGILLSTGQVQCGQVHCRLPYTAPPVHLKADMDGPLSNRGEKVNGASWGLVGWEPSHGGWVSASVPPSWSGYCTTVWQSLSVQNPTQVTWHLLVCSVCPDCSRGFLAVPTNHLAFSFHICKSGLKCWGSRHGLKHIPLRLQLLSFLSCLLGENIPSMGWGAEARGRSPTRLHIRDRIHFWLSGAIDQSP